MDSLSLAIPPFSDGKCASVDNQEHSSLSLSSSGTNPIAIDVLKKIPGITLKNSAVVAMHIDSLEEVYFTFLFNVA